MQKIIVVSQRLYDILKGRDINLGMLSDINYMLDNLSVSDIAEIVLLTNQFPFSNDFVSTINMEHILQSELFNDEAKEDVARRYKQRYEHLYQQYKTECKEFVAVYTLNYVEEKLWVVVQQKQHIGENDPNMLRIGFNNQFFDSLIEQVLQTEKFETVCKSSLFTQYLESCN